MNDYLPFLDALFRTAANSDKEAISELFLYYAHICNPAPAVFRTLVKYSAYHASRLERGNAKRRKQELARHAVKALERRRISLDEINEIRRQAYDEGLPDTIVNTLRAKRELLEHPTDLRHFYKRAARVLDAITDRRYHNWFIDCLFKELEDQPVEVRLLSKPERKNVRRKEDGKVRASKKARRDL